MNKILRIILNLAASAIFRYVDKDGNGEVSIKEVNTVLSELKSLVIKKGNK